MINQELESDYILREQSWSIQKGYIEVQSEIGKGACFRLYFPVNEP